jgi:hypothetical protein
MSSVLRSAMPRWLQIALSLVLFAAVMLLLRWALYAWMPTLDEVFDSYVGRTGHWALVIIALGVCATIGFWPRTPDGKLRRVLPPRR